jgi:hypothetical protein
MREEKHGDVSKCRGKAMLSSHMQSSVTCEREGSTEGPGGNPVLTIEVEHLVLSPGHCFLLLFDPLIGAFLSDMPIFAALIAHVFVIANTWALIGGVIGLPAMIAAVRLISYH